MCARVCACREGEGRLSRVENTVIHTQKWSHTQSCTHIDSHTIIYTQRLSMNTWTHTHSHSTLTHTDCHTQSHTQTHIHHTLTHMHRLSDCHNHTHRLAHTIPTVCLYECVEYESLCESMCAWESLYVNDCVRVYVCV